MGAVHTIWIDVGHALLELLRSRKVAILVLIPSPAVPQLTSFIRGESTNHTLKQCSRVYIKATQVSPRNLAEETTHCSHR